MKTLCERAHLYPIEVKTEVKSIIKEEVINIEGSPLNIKFITLDIDPDTGEVI